MKFVASGAVACLILSRFKIIISEKCLKQEIL